MPTTGMSPSDLRAGANRILTTIAQGYTNNDYVGNYLFPLAETIEHGGQIIQFDDSAFEVYDDTLAPGSEYQQIQNGYSGAPYTLDNKGLEYFLPDQYLNESRLRGIAWDELAVNSVMNATALKLEVEQATLATNSANYGSNTAALSGTAQWDNASSDPLATVNTWKSSIVQSVGKMPNTMVMGYPVFLALTNNAKIRAQFQYTSAQSITVDMLQAYFGVDKLVVGSALQNTGSGTRSFVWGKNVILAYTNPDALSSPRIPYAVNQKISRFMPSFGYTYVMSGHPYMKSPVREERRDGTFYQGRFDRRAVIASATSGFLGQTVVS